MLKILYYFAKNKLNKISKFFLQDLGILALITLLIISAFLAYYKFVLLLNETLRQTIFAILWINYIALFNISLIFSQFIEEKEAILFTNSTFPLEKTLLFFMLKRFLNKAFHLILQFVIILPLLIFLNIPFLLKSCIFLSFFLIGLRSILWDYIQKLLPNYRIISWPYIFLMLILWAFITLRIDLFYLGIIFELLSITILTVLIRKTYLNFLILQKRSSYLKKRSARYYPNKVSSIFIISKTIIKLLNKTEIFITFTVLSGLLYGICYIFFNASLMEKEQIKIALILFWQLIFFIISSLNMSINDSQLIYIIKLQPVSFKKFFIISNCIFLFVFIFLSPVFVFSLLRETITTLFCFLFGVSWLIFFWCLSFILKYKKIFLILVGFLSFLVFLFGIFLLKWYFLIIWFPIIIITWKIGNKRYLNMTEELL